MSQTIDQKTRLDVADLSDGNPGAINLMMNVVLEYPPETAQSMLNFFQKHGIRGTRIWYVFKELCDEDVSKLVKRCAAGDEEMLAAIKAKIPSVAKSA